VLFFAHNIVEVMLQALGSNCAGQCAEAMQVCGTTRLIIDYPSFGPRSPLTSTYRHCAVTCILGTEWAVQGLSYVLAVPRVMRPTGIHSMLSPYPSSATRSPSLSHPLSSLPRLYLLQA
jgi:hypothetical protein